MIPVIGYHDLIRTKISSRRLKDLADVEENRTLLKMKE